MSRKLIEAEHLSQHFEVGGLFARATLRAVNDVSLSIAPGEALGLVGESGSGKSTIGRLLLGLHKPTGGRVLLDGQDIARLPAAELRRLRSRMQLVFQDPHASLDPRRRIGAQIADGLAIHNILPAERHAARVAELLEQVGLDARHAARAPHEFSGGQRQRIAIARALATNPDFIVADEPVSALDVSVQAQILALLADLRARLGLALLFISHDLPVVRSLCDRVAVLYLGRVVEQGPVAEVMSVPRHPYTRALLSAAPSIDAAGRQSRIVLQGDPPNPAAIPSGCAFRTRCPWAMPACADSVPALAEIAPGHHAACLRAADPLL